MYTFGEEYDRMLNPPNYSLGDGVNQRRRRRTTLPDGRAVDSAMGQGLATGAADAVAGAIPAAMPGARPVYPAGANPAGEFVFDPFDVPGAGVVQPPPGPPVPISPVAPGSVHVGTSHAGLSDLGKTIARERELRGASPTSKVVDTDWGTEVLPPMANPKSTHNRLKQAAIGALEGIIASSNATKGDPWAALAGAGVGAAAGGIKPEMVQALTREHEIDRAALETERAVGVTGAATKIAEDTAQAQYARERPALEREKIRQEGMDKAETRRIQQQGIRTRAETAAAKLAEDRRHNLEQEKDGGSKGRKSAGDRRKASTAVKGFSAQADKHLELKKAADAEIVRLEEELHNLDAGVNRNKEPWTRGTDAAGNETIVDPEYKARKTSLEKRLERAQRESEYRQSEADKAANERTKAEADFAGTEDDTPTPGRNGRMKASNLAAAARELGYTTDAKGLAATRKWLEDHEIEVYE